MKRAYLVAGARMSESFLASVLKDRGRDEKIIAVDAGLEYLDRIGLCPDIVIGDFDTLGAEVLEKCSDKKGIEIFRYDPVKDASDLELAAELCRERGARELWALGALGGRMDHTLANLFLVCKWSAQELRLVLLDECNKIYVIEENTRIYRNAQYGKYVSFFPMGEPFPRLSLRGVKYPLEGFRPDPYKNPSFLISNEIREDFAEIELEGGRLLVIESRDGISNRTA